MKVSVIIPTHNRSKLVKKAIDSVLKQTYTNYEIIVVSDGSTDDTDLILEKYKEQNSKIKYISYYPAKGGNYARNIGINFAVGEYIAFLDDDDEWMPDKLELQMLEFSKNEKIGLVYTGVEVIYHYDDKTIKYYSLPQKVGDLSKDILINNCIGTTSSVIVKRSVLNKSGIFDEKLKALQDYDLWIRICQVTNIGAVFKPLVKYNNFTWSMQISSNLKKYEEAIKEIENKYIVFFQNNKELLFKYRLASNSLLVNKALRNNDRKAARKYLKYYFKIKPSFKWLIMYIITYIPYNFILRLRSLKK